MGLPKVDSYVKTTPTFFKTTRGTTGAGFDTNSNTYVDVTSIASITSVPDDAKIIWFARFLKNTAGNGFVAMRDGTNTFKEISTVPSALFNVEETDGLTVQNSGGAATVKIQAKSDDANNVSVIGPSACSFVCTDGDTPLVIFGPQPETTLKIPWRASIAKIFLYYTAGGVITTTDQASLNGLLAFEEDLSSGDVYDAELSFTYPNEQVSNAFEIAFENTMVEGQYLIFDWSGHGINWS